MRKTKVKKAIIASIALVAILLAASIIVYFYQLMKNKLVMNTAEKIESVFLQDTTTFQELVGTIQNNAVDSTFSVHVDVSREEAGLQERLFRIGNITYSTVIDPTDQDTMNQESFEAVCSSIHEKVQAVVKKYNLYGIRVQRGRIRIVLEVTNNGFASELLYVDDEQASMTTLESMIPQAILDCKQIKNHWFAVVSYDPEYTP